MPTYWLIALTKDSGSDHERLTRPAVCCWPGIPVDNCSWTCTADLAGSWWWWGDRACQYTLICSQSAPATGSHKRWVLELWRPAGNNISMGNIHHPGSLTHQLYLTVATLDRGLIPSPKPQSILMHLTNPPQLNPSLSENRPSRNCPIPFSSTLG